MLSILLAVVYLFTVIGMCPNWAQNIQNILLAIKQHKFMAPLFHVYRKGNVWKDNDSRQIYVWEKCTSKICVVVGLIGNIKKQANDWNIYMSLRHVKGVALFEEVHGSPSVCVSGRVCLPFISYMWETLWCRFNVRWAKLTTVCNKILLMYLRGIIICLGSSLNMQQAC